MYVVQESRLLKVSYVLRSAGWVGMLVLVLVSLAQTSDILFAMQSSEAQILQNQADHVLLTQRLGELDGRMRVIEKYAMELQMANVRERVTRIEEALRLIWFVAAGIGLLIMEKLPGIVGSLIRVARRNGATKTE
jgi:hypothetical protein